MFKPAVLTFATKDIDDYAALTRDINSAYCKKHGYDFVSESERTLDDSYDPHWEKVALINRQLKNARRNWVFFIDADAAFNHDDLKIESIMKMAPKGADVIMCHDGDNKEDLSAEERKKKHYVNTGAIIAKNSQWARKFFKHWIDTAGKYKKGAELQDQDRMVEMLKNDELGAFSKGKVHVMPINAFNSTHGRPDADTFVVHMMKRDSDERIKRFRKILEKGPAKSPEEIVQSAFDSRPKYDSKIAIVTMYDDPIANYSRFSTAVTNIYGSKHGYETIVVRERLSDRDPQWDKVYAVGRVLDQQQHDYVMWIDSDATFQDHSIKLEDIIAEYMGDADMLICDDRPNKGAFARPNMMYPNTGTFIFRNNEWSRNFANTWWENPMNKENARYHEQDVLMNLWTEDRDNLKKKLKLAKYDLMNSAFRELPAFNTLKGGNRDTFVIHMMARNAKDRRGVFEEMLKKHMGDVEPHSFYFSDRLSSELQQASTPCDRDDSTAFIVIGVLLVIIAGFMMWRFFVLLERGPSKKEPKQSRVTGPRDVPNLKRDNAANPKKRDI